MTPLTLCCLLLFVVLGLQDHTSCYYPDGTYIEADRPCIGNGTQESFCCGTQGVICLSDKICHYNDTTSQNGVSYGRGSCTDQSFKSPACPDFCLSAYFWCTRLLMTNKILAIAPSNKFARMYPCGGPTDSYCCSLDGSPCSCESGNITLAASSSNVSLIAFIPPAASLTSLGSQPVLNSATNCKWLKERIWTVADVTMKSSYNRTFDGNSVELDPAVCHRRFFGYNNDVDFNTAVWKCHFSTYFIFSRHFQTRSCHWSSCDCTVCYHHRTRRFTYWLPPPDPVIDDSLTWTSGQQYSKR